MGIGWRSGLTDLGTLARPARLMLWATLLKGLTVSVFGLNFPLYLTALGHGVDTVGLVNAVMSFASFASTLPLGLLADRGGRRWVMWTAGIGTPVSLLGVALADTLPWLLFWGTVNGLVVSGYWVVVAPVLTEASEPDDRMRLFAVNAFLLWGLGAVGTVLGGFVPEVVGAAAGEGALTAGPLRAGLLASVLLAALGGIPLCLMPDTRQAVPASTAVGRPGRNLGLLTLLFLPYVAVYLGEGMVYPFLQVFFSAQFGLEPGALGALLSLAGPAAGAATLLTPAIASKFGPLLGTVVVQALVLPAVVALGTSPWLGGAVAAAYARAALRSMASALYTRLVMERAPPGQRGVAGSLDALGYGVGMTLGPLVSGAMQVHVGFAVPFALGGVCYVVGSALVWAGRRRDAAAGPRAEA